MPAVIYGTILAARSAGRLVDRFRFPPWRAVAVGGVVALTLTGVAFAKDLDVPSAKQPNLALVDLLRAHGLHDGVGDYWSASLTTVLSANRVRVRPVIPDRSKRLVRYGRQSAADWYRGVDFNFVVYDLARPWRRVNAESAEATFGPASEHLAVGTYRILVWERPFHLSVTSYTRK
jgi:hypothetical protein